MKEYSAAYNKYEDQVRQLNKEYHQRLEEYQKEFMDTCVLKPGDVIRADREIQTVSRMSFDGQNINVFVFRKKKDGTDSKLDKMCYDASWNRDFEKID